MSIELLIGPNDDGRRLDRIVRKTLDKLPLSAIHRLFRQRQVSLDGIPAQASDRVRSGSRLVLRINGDLSDQRTVPLRPAAPESTGTALDILWTGAGLLIVNKPAGIAVHGPDSLLDLVNAYLADAVEPSLSFKPGPLHRLDRPTSGVIVFSRDIGGARNFSSALRDRRIGKRYLAVLDGDLAVTDLWHDRLQRTPDRSVVRVLPADDPAGQAAATRVTPLARCGTHTLVLADIGTGRTHQIRTQAASRGHPLAGDQKYGGSNQDGGLLLHAYELLFPPDFALAVPRVVRAPLPARFLRRIRDLFGEKKETSLRDSPPTDAMLSAIL